MESEENKNKMPEEIVNFFTKRSEADLPRYTARLNSYVDLRKKRLRAANARRHAEHGRDRKRSSSKKGEQDQKEKPADGIERQGGDEERVSRKRGGGEKCIHQSRSFSRSGSQAPSDACCRRRRKRCGRRRRRRSRCRRRRRRCSRRRRRRRSCSRRRRRRSCKRRRRRCRRRRR